MFNKKLKKEIETNRALIDSLFLITRKLCPHLDYTNAVDMHNKNRYIRICNICKFMKEITKEEFYSEKFATEIAFLERNRKQIDDEINKITALADKDIK